MVKRLLILGAIALALGVAVRLSITPAPAAPVPVSVPGGIEHGLADLQGVPSGTSAAGQRAHWEPVWTRPTPDIASVSLSTDGMNVAWVDHAGSIRRMTVADGKTIFRTNPIAGVNRVVALPQGLGILGYARMNPASTIVHRLDAATGSGDITFGVEGAIWNVAAGEGGFDAVVATGRNHLYVLPITTSVPNLVRTGGDPASAAVPPAKMVRIDTPGIAGSLAVSEGVIPPVVAAGNWEKTGAGLWGLDGTARWYHPDDQPDRVYDIRLSADGSVAIAVSSRGIHRTDARLSVWDAHTGKLLWSQDLNASDPKMLVSANASVIAVSYARDVDGNGTISDTAERRLVLFDRAGHRAFSEKGGLFFAPELVALSADGQRVTVKDGAGFLWTLDSHGRILSRVRLPLDPKTGASPLMLETIATPDGKLILVRRGDGQITLFKAVSQ